MIAPILTTKLNIPLLRTARVTRTRLVQRLTAGLWQENGFTRKLSLISAPAGYGKTTLVTEWLHYLSDDNPGFQPTGAWLSLDETDNDPTLFLSYLIAAIQTHHPGFGEVSRSLIQSPQPPPVEVILTTLLNEMAVLPTPYILVLDDYHAIRVAAIHQQTAVLLERLPIFVHMVLITREDPLLPLARLRARGHLLEIRGTDLRFSLQECNGFLQQVMGIPLSMDDVATLERRTEGWIAGLQLAALSLQGHDDPAGFVKAFAGSNRFVLDYLVEEVYQRQPREIQDFLLRTSILDRLSESLCDAVAGISNSQEILESLEQANLFIVPLDQSRTWYRYHRLFVELLRHRLRRLKDLNTTGLHDRASSWFEQNRFLAEAIEHAIAAGNWESASHVMASVNPDMLKRGEIATLNRWYNAFPQEVLLANPKLCFDYCWALLLAVQYEAAAPLLDHVEQAAREIPEFLGEVLAAQAYLARGQGDHAAMVENSQRALALLPKSSVSSRGLVTINLGIAYWHMGQMAAAETALAEALEAAQATGNHYALLTALIFQGRIYGVQGQLQKGAEFFLQSIERGGRIPINALAHLDMSVLQYEWNNLEESERHLEAAVELSQRGGNAEFLVSCWLFKIRIRLAQGDLSGTRQALADVQERVEVGDIPVNTTSRVIATQVHLALEVGDLPTALEWMDQLDEQVDCHPFYRFLGLLQARVLIAQNDLTAARTHLERCSETASQNGWGYGLIATQIRQALAAGKRETALEYLAEALHRAKPEGFIRTFVEGGHGLVPLLQEAARRGLEPAYVGKILGAMPGQPGRMQPSGRSSLVEPLSERELEVLRLVTAGLSNRQIAEQLVISPGTAKSHVHNICAKMGVRNRTEAAARATELGLV